MDILVFTANDAFQMIDLGSKHPLPQTTVSWHLCLFESNLTVTIQDRFVEQFIFFHSNSGTEHQLLIIDFA